MATISKYASAPFNYDRRAATYARHRGVHSGVVEHLVGSGVFDANTRVLDVGCGTGNYARALSSITGCRMSGVEPSLEMLGHARDTTNWEALVQGKAERLPFPDERFDVVMSTDVIHHVTDRDVYFREAARVLGPGGYLITVTDSHEDLARRKPLSSHFPETLAIELERYPNVSTLQREMQLAGFDRSRVEETSLEYDLTDSQAFRDRAYSSLLLIDDEAFQRGLARLEVELARGPVRSLSLYTILWGTREQRTAN